MKRAAVVLLLGLSGCVTQAAVTAPRPGTTVALAPTQVVVGAREYLGSVAAGPDGLVLTPQGAEAVAGAQVRVFRPGLGNSDGIEAKAAAAGICVQAGGRYDPAAVGRFEPRSGGAGSWVFDGACV